MIAADVATPTGAERATKGQEMVLNLAAKVTGIEYNRFHHADMFSSNMRIATEMLQAAVRNRVEKFLVVSTACIYPHDAEVPTPESEGDRAPPSQERRVRVGKADGRDLGKHIDAETALAVAVCRPFNAYGPRDHWDEETSHVIPALMRRVLDGENPVVVWGTGNQTRAFLHARDAAAGMKLIAEKADSPEPINIGHDQEISIRDLALKILELTGVSADLLFDTSKPDGHSRRAADVTRLRQVTGWAPDTPLDVGLKEMIAEYERLKG